jgi:parallel beta-helix repeat protein
VTNFYVSTQGNDSASGKSSSTAFKSLAKAQAAMRASAGADTTYISKGTYFLPSAVTLTSADSNSAYSAYQGQQVVLSQGKPVSGWTGGANGVWSAHVDASEVQQFVVNGVQQTQARYGAVDPANPLRSGWMWAQKLPSGRNPETQMAYNKADFGQGQLAPGMKVTVFSDEGYSSDFLTIKSVDTNAGVMTFAEPATYEIGTHSRFFVSNAKGALDRTGEWYFDKSAKTLYYKAPSGFDGTGAVAAGGDTSLITTEGAKNVSISGLTFTNATTTEQTDDVGTAALDIRDSSGILATGNTFVNDAKGVRISGASSKNTISNNKFNHLWSEAVELTPETHENTITHNTITNSGEVFATSGAIHMEESWGNTISYNRIEHVPRFGIAEINYDAGEKSGANVIEYNQILNSGEKTPDVGAIYLYSHEDSGALGDTINGNKIINPGGLNTTKGAFVAGNDLGNGIYLDDYASNAKITGNFIQGASFGGVYLHGGKNNAVVNNFVLGNSKYGIELNPLDRSMSGTSVNHNIVQVSATGENTVDLDPSFVSRSAVSNNVYYSPSGVKPEMADVSYAAWTSTGGDAGSTVTSNPGFANAASGDYELLSGSLA